ncbi:PIN domain-containing protein [Anabaena sp. UHCC 0187]|uniref:type II toxin-antitoxin system VapC family toxin n=1 Tax=Anabaena sp. UHCC 0187 TaxID=2590018 RepID=UPI00144549E6|nr:PIN domain-containing protein [Anabaena sp. UHCC 0187]MDP5016597.1 PIN domain-containing protein [Dolichospermum sp.]MTJ11857.1 PIN domain-containing protein [Anabaena sp. UHCC 0187]
MTAILDISFLVSTIDIKDENYGRVLDIIVNLKEVLVLPTTVLPEVCHLLTSRLGYPTTKQVLSELVNSNVIIEGINKTDLKRVTEILSQYADSELDFVDATIVAIAERMNIPKILTLDKHIFSIINPQHCAAFEIFP